MSVDNSISAAKEKAIQLGVFELVCDVVDYTPNSQNEEAGLFNADKTIEWEGCAIRHWSSGAFLSFRSGCTIKTSDGTDLFHGYKEAVQDLEIYTFRFGAWVERLRKHVEQLKQAKELAEKQQAASEDAEKLKPFGDVDF